MAFKTFAPGVLTSSDVNTFLMRQAVITCTSSTRPASPSEGMTIYETDTDLYATYSGSAWVYLGGWTTYTPTITGTGWDIGDGTITARYALIGDAVTLQLSIGWGSTSTYGGAGLRISLPVTATMPGTTTPFHSSVQLRDTSAATGFPGTSVYMSTSTIAVYAHGVAASFATLDEITSTKPFTWASGDSISLTTTYKAA